MKKFAIFFTLILICLSTQASFAQKASSAEEKATFVKGTRLLEQEPLSKNAKKIREGLLIWLIQAPDVSVTLCSDFLSPIMDKKYKYSSEATGQFTYGMGAFIIENPASAKDNNAVYEAGLESVLKMYESILKEKPKEVNEFMSSMIEKRDKRQLAEYITDILSKGGCKS